VTKLPLVVVEWKDAWIDGSDPVNLADVKASHKPKIIVTLGYLLLQDEVGVSLANEYYQDEDVYRGRTFIYAPMLVSVKEHSLVKARKKVARAKPPVSPVVIDIPESGESETAQS